MLASLPPSYTHRPLPWSQQQKQTPRSDTEKVGAEFFVPRCCSLSKGRWQCYWMGLNDSGSNPRKASSWPQPYCGPLLSQYSDSVPSRMQSALQLTQLYCKQQIVELLEALSRCEVLTISYIVAYIEGRMVANHTCLPLFYSLISCWPYIDLAAFWSWSLHTALSFKVEF